MYSKVKYIFTFFRVWQILSYNFVVIKYILEKYLKLVVTLYRTKRNINFIVYWFYSKYLNDIFLWRKTRLKLHNITIIFVVKTPRETTIFYISCHAHAFRFTYTNIGFTWVLVNSKLWYRCGVRLKNAPVYPVKRTFY